MKNICARLILSLALLAVFASSSAATFDGSNPYPPMCPNGPGGPCAV